MPETDPDPGPRSWTDLYVRTRPGMRNLGRTRVGESDWPARIPTRPLVPFQFVNHNIPTSIGRTVPPGNPIALGVHPVYAQPHMEPQRHRWKRWWGQTALWWLYHSSVEMGNTLERSLINADPISIYHIL